MKQIISSTTQRVSDNTSMNVNAAIRKQTIESLNAYKDADSNEISDRISQLNYEWDVERCLETNAATILLLSSLLGLKSSRLWFLLTGTVGAFLLQHALEGWCPPVPFMRKMGIRTAEEINNEKIVLKILRGDFFQNNSEAAQILAVVEKQ